MGMFLRRGPAPKLGTPIGSLAVGTVIKLNENGSPAKFYVAKHDYESKLNRNGRTLVVRKDCYDMRAFSSSNNAFSGSSMDTWLNGPYKGLLDAEVQDAMGRTAFYYTPGKGNNTVSVLNRAVFLLSATELGTSGSTGNTEGTALSSAVCSQLAIAYRNGSAVTQWTRTPSTRYNGYVIHLNTEGGPRINYFSESSGSRPVFTLPASFKLTDDMLVA